MALEGRLGPTGAADLLVQLVDQERTGILDVAAGGVDRKLLLVDGEVVYVASSEATITSEFPTRPMPPPTQNPLTAAITGTAHS